MSVSQSEFFSPKEADSLLLACKSLHKLGELDEAISLSNRAVRVSEKDHSVLKDVHHFRFILQKQLGDQLGALKTMLALVEGTDNPKEKKSVNFESKILQVQFYCWFVDVIIVINGWLYY
jgi:hypothetical protein